MDNVFVGKIVNTHGIKGELRIKSDFEFKNRVFTKGTKVIIKGNEYIINSYRVHKEFDMITLEGFDNINDVLFLKGANLLVNRDELKLGTDDYLLGDLIDLNIVLNDNIIGKVIDYTVGVNPLLCIINDGKNYYIPLNGSFIESVSINDGNIIVNESVKGLML